MTALSMCNKTLIGKKKASKSFIKPQQAQMQREKRYFSCYASMFYITTVYVAVVYIIDVRRISYFTDILDFSNEMLFSRFIN